MEKKVSISCWDLAGPRQVYSFAVKGEHWIKAFDDKQRFAVIRDEKEAQIWDLALGQKVGRLDCTIRQFNAPTVSPDGRFAVDVGENGLQLSELATSQLVFSLRTGGNFCVDAPDGRILAIQGRHLSGKLYLCDLPTGRIIRELEDPGQPLAFLARQPAAGDKLAHGPHPRLGHSHRQRNGAVARSRNWFAHCLTEFRADASCIKRRPTALVGP